MNILFLTLSRFTSLNDRGIYPDLVRKFCREGHQMYVVAPMERKFKKQGGLFREENLTLIKIKTLNLQQSGVIEKGLAYLMLEFQFKQAIKKYLSKVRFDLVLYSTPPINITKAVEYVKKRDNSTTYLLLKDIYPQAAVDDGIFDGNGPIYKYFRRQEKKLYQLSDYIGCMSQANVDYLIRHNPEIPLNKLEVNPNSIEPLEVPVQDFEKDAFRKKHGIPEDALILIYGGNLGKSQGIEFYLDIMKMKAGDERFFFIAVGSGSAFGQIKRFIDENKIANALLISYLPKQEFDVMVALSDVGLVFLNSYFTVPNFPSRMLSYMDQKKPVLAATDKVTDLGNIITENKFGYWSLHGDMESFNKNLELLFKNKSELSHMGQIANQFLQKHFNVDVSFQLIESKI
ncbi:MAG: glycosyltransferase family 4 protein [Lentimicrobiaceae bacterium]|nr:glycosyltransferase family 4 protein [Lentimicrobiaceae bacterium]